MKVLIMGGTGFVSGSLSKYLIKKGYQVDIFTRGKSKLNYSGVFKHHIGDRRSIEDLNNTIRNIKYDYVFDISAYNKEDVENLCKVLNKEKLKRYVFCSSGAVYEPSENMMDENFRVGLNKYWKDYGVEKHKAEKYLMNLNKSEKLPVVIFRPTYIYGPNNNLYRESYIFDRLSEGKDIPVPAGKTKVQFIYIDDLLKVFESSIYEEKSVGQVYNVTNSEVVTWTKLIKSAIDVTKKVSNIKYIEETLTNSSREYFPFRNCTYLLSIKKLEDSGLYVPKVGLIEGLSLSYIWYFNNKVNLSDKKMNKIDYVLSKSC